MKIHRIGFGNFRSVGDDIVWIGYEKKVNVFIGSNNSGKSNILRFFEWFCSQKESKVNMDSLDYHTRDRKNLLRISFDFSFEHDDRLLGYEGQQFLLDFKCVADTKNWLEGPFDSLEPRKDLNKINEIMKKFLNGTYFQAVPDKNQWEKYRNQIYDRIGAILTSNLPKTYLIPQFRRITPSENYGIDGQGIVETLAAWQHPKINADEDIDKFIKIQNLLKRLLNLPNLEMEVAHTNDHIIVKNNDLRLPLESYGTGVHELIILAAAVYSKKDSVFLIEEPEIHLHPKLQKEFLNFIVNETNNRYLITTHSNAFIQPSENIEVVHLRLNEGATKGIVVESSKEVLDILDDLGVKASDILQSNSVIWVEGPSDRIYLTKWLSLLFPDIIEGIDYSIMFYGGKLLSHLSMERDSFLGHEDLIPLLKINQKSIVLIDSDRKKIEDEVNETKKRVQRECEENGLYCWITDGKEIENYLTNDCLNRAYKEITAVDCNIEFGTFDVLENKLKEALGDKWEKCWSYSVSKPKGARKIIDNIRFEDITPELENHLKRVYEVIRSGVGEFIPRPVL